jgi:predicted DNA-binding transcriptional regulator AlpA
MERQELLALPAVVDVPTAAKALGLSRTAAYELIRNDEWPTPVFRLGRLIKIPTAPILQLMVDVVTAGRTLGISRDGAYDLVRRREFPVRTVKVGRLYRVPRPDLFRVLGIEPPHPNDDAAQQKRSMPRSWSDAVKACNRCRVGWRYRMGVHDPVTGAVWKGRVVASLSCEGGS